jgi:hypothetical protein
MPGDCVGFRSFVVSLVCLVCLGGLKSLESQSWLNDISVRLRDASDQSHKVESIRANMNCDGPLSTACSGLLSKFPNREIQPSQFCFLEMSYGMMRSAILYLDFFFRVERRGKNLGKGHINSTFESRIVVPKTTSSMMTTVQTCYISLYSV